MQWPPGAATRLGRHEWVDASGSGRARRAPLRVRLDLAYDGTAFSGWAAQPALRTVQGELSAALTTVLRSPEPVARDGGRTHGRRRARAGAGRPRRPRPSGVGVAAGALRPGPGAALVSRLAGILPADVVVRRRARRPTASTLASRRSSGATSTASPTPTAGVTRCGGATRSGGAGRSTSMRWTRRPARSSGCATSPPSAGSARGDDHAHPARLLVDAGSTTGCSRPRCAPTPSATRWCDRSSGPWCRWARDAGRWPIRDGSWPSGCGAGGPRGAGARAEPRGGRLPARRRAGRAAGPARAVAGCSTRAEGPGRGGRVCRACSGSAVPVTRPHGIRQA